MEKFKRYCVSLKEFKEFDGNHIRIKDFEFLDLYVHEAGDWGRGDTFEPMTGWCVTDNTTGLFVIEGASDPEEAYFKADNLLHEKGVERVKIAVKKHLVL